MAAEIVFGAVAGSLALLADAGHMLTDAAALGLALVAATFAVRPAHGRWTFGFRRLEILAAHVNGIVLVVVGVVIVYTAIRGLNAAIAGLAAWILVPHPNGLGQYLLASLVASIAHLMVGAFLVAITAAVRGVGVAELEPLAIVSHLVLSIPLYVPILALFVFGYHAYSLWLVLV